MAKRGRKKVAKTNVEPPMSSCLIICEDVHMSVARDRHVISGVIDGIVVPEIPALIGPFVAYVRFSNVYSGQNVRLALTNAGTGDEAFSFAAQSPKNSDPLKNHTLILKIPPFEIRAPGRYIFSAVHNGVPFASSPIVVDIPPTDNPESTREQSEQ